MFIMEEIEDLIFIQGSVNVDVFKAWASRSLLRGIQWIPHLMKLQSFDSILRVANAGSHGIGSCW
jgi:hypothetical protein